jgi:hypothetical protein
MSLSLFGIQMTIIVGIGYKKRVFIDVSFLGLKTKALIAPEMLYHVLFKTISQTILGLYFFIVRHF